MQIPESIINEIRDRADVAEVVGRFVDLRRAGVNYKAVCPFHEEKTPSFVVSPDKQIWHCFGCGKGGNVFTFLMEMEGVSFPEAVRALGKQYGVEVPTQDEPDQRPKNEILYRITDFAARWYQRNLTEDVGKAARAYLEKRGIGEAAWEKFGLGFAPDRWDGFYRIAQSKKVPLDSTIQLKLIVKGERGYYDYFRDRVMFPIALQSGRTVGFGARTMRKDVEPKYLNSIDSPIYHKRKILYGMHAARSAIRERRTALLVEGYTDCISLHLGGFDNTVASCGTAITADHARLLRRVTRSVVLVPDGDSAGREAALASGAVFLAEGIDVHVARLDDGDDPDSALRGRGAENFAKKVGGALEYFEYLGYSMKDRAMTPQRKEALAQRITAGLGSTRNRLRYEVFMQDVARVLGVSPESLPKYRDRRDTAVVDAPSQPQIEVELDPHRVELEKLLLRLMLESTPEAAMAREKLDADDFSAGNLRKFYNLLDSAWENHIDIRSNGFQQMAEKAGLEGLAAEISLITIPPGNPGKLLNDTVRRVKELQIRTELSALRGKLRDLAEESEEAIAVAEHYARLKRALDEL